MANDIFGGVALGNLLFANIMWFLYYKAGTRITAYYWWTWFSVLVVMYAAWGPVVLSWALLQSDFKVADFLFFYSSLWSIAGPMVGYFIPIVILVFAYN